MKWLTDHYCVYCCCYAVYTAWLLCGVCCCSRRWMIQAWRMWHMRLLCWHWSQLGSTSNWRLQKLPARLPMMHRVSLHTILLTVQVVNVACNIYWSNSIVVATGKSVSIEPRLKLKLYLTFVATVPRFCNPLYQGICMLHSIDNWTVAALNLFR